MKTLKQLADLGAAAAFSDNKRYHYMSVSEQSHSWQADEPARQAFAQAVKDAVMEDLVTNQISSPSKPWTLPPPPEGHQWHRQDWTEWMLPEGWRPLLLDEIRAAGDECLSFNRWIPCNTGRRTVESVIHCRTRRPLPTPEPVLVPLDIDDIRATDEFRHKESHVVETADHWNCEEVTLSWSDSPSYEALSTHYLRRQHGSTEWKPCTKESQP